MKVYLRGSQDFQKVYRRGIRYDAALMTAFVLPNELSYHRLGVTASKKAVGNAVQRNRAKRVLRETFRLSEGSMLDLGQKYDWVLNAKGKLVNVNTTLALREFQRILESVATRETHDGGLQMA
jgi:ribonuclease P protein component